MTDDFDEEELPVSSLGKRLAAGVRNLWSEVQRITKVQHAQAAEIAAIQAQIREMERELHGLRVSRGKAVAAKQRLEAEVQQMKRMVQ